MSDDVRLGYVGLGNIGGPMAARLAQWPGGLTVFDLSDEAVERLVEAGAARADSLPELAKRADVIGICVVNDAQVHAVVADLVEAAAHAGLDDGVGHGARADVVVAGPHR